jgi:predicted ArsR family transcriptional regulator
MAQSTRKRSGPATPPTPPGDLRAGAQTSEQASEDSDVSHHQILASLSRAAVLKLLRSRAEPLGVVEVAQHVGLHQNTVRSHLDLLVSSGYALRRSEPPRGPGRPRVVYEATAAPEGDRNYRLLAELLTEHLATSSKSPAKDAVDAGRSWAASTTRRLRDSDRAGKALAPEVSDEEADEEAIAAVIRILGDSGFAPERSADGTSINLHRCPFRELAESYSDVVCGAHLGILQGALADLGAKVTATRLLPFVAPGLCVATLTRAPAGPRAATTE